MNQTTFTVPRPQSVRLLFSGGVLGLAALLPVTVTAADAIVAPSATIKVAAEQPQPKPKAEKSPEKGFTTLGAGGEVEIQYDIIDADFEKRIMIFIGNVVVTEPRVVLKTDRAVITYDAQGKLLNIEAVGNVIIDQHADDRHATSGKATYDVTSGDITLTEKPTLKTAQFTMIDAAKIICNRDTGKAHAEGGRIIGAPQPQKPDAAGTSGTPDATRKSEKHDNK